MTLTCTTWQYQYQDRKLCTPPESVSHSNRMHCLTAPAPRCDIVSGGVQSLSAWGVVETASCFRRMIVLSQKTFPLLMMLKGGLREWFLCGSHMKTMSDYVISFCLSSQLACVHMCVYVCGICLCVRICECGCLYVCLVFVFVFIIVSVCLWVGVCVYACVCVVHSD